MCVMTLVEKFNFGVFLFLFFIIKYIFTIIIKTSTNERLLYNKREVYLI